MDDIKQQDLLSKEQEAKKFLEELPESFKNDDIQDVIVITIDSNGMPNWSHTTMWNMDVIKFLELTKLAKFTDIYEK